MCVLILFFEIAHRRTGTYHYLFKREKPTRPSPRAQPTNMYTSIATVFKINRIVNLKLDRLFSYGSNEYSAVAPNLVCLLPVY